MHKKLIKMLVLCTIVVTMATSFASAQSPYFTYIICDCENVDATINSVSVPIETLILSEEGVSYVFDAVAHSGYTMVNCYMKESWGEVDLIIEFAGGGYEIIPIPVRIITIHAEVIFGP